jgi:hypothetical protein
MLLAIFKQFIKINLIALVFKKPTNSAPFDRYAIENYQLLDAEIIA